MERVSGKRHGGSKKGSSIPTVGNRSGTSLVVFGVRPIIVNAVTVLSGGFRIPVPSSSLKTWSRSEGKHVVPRQGLLGTRRH